MIYIHVLDEFSLSGGGVRSVVADVSKEMANRDLKVYICSLGVPNNTIYNECIKWSKENNINYILLRSSRESLFCAAYRLRQLLKKIVKLEQCCLYLHLKRGVLTGILASLFIGNIRRVEVFHSNYLNYYFQAILCRYYIDHYLAVSKESQEQLVTRYGIKPSKITLAYNGIDPQAVKSKIKPIPRNLNVFQLFSAGRFTIQKDLKTAVSAFYMFRTKNPLLSSEYLIAGDGPLRNDAENISNGQVTFLGMIERSDVYSHIAAADSVLFSSLWEGHSIALLEVIAIGCPVIVSDIPAFKEVLCFKSLSKSELFRPEPFGALFRKEDIASCEAAINYMAHHRECFNSMRSFMLSLADKYTVSKQVDVYVKVAK